jgi:hypothetical protein
MTWLNHITFRDHDFIAGLGPQTLEVLGAPTAPPVSPLVCFENATGRIDPLKALRYE